MNYLHDYHAGNAADVFKHIILLALINTLKIKETSFCFINTHAGSGLYDLTSDASQKSGEYLNGIARLYDRNFNHPLLNQYLTIVKNFNTRTAQGQCRYYPGSPCIAHAVIRKQDRIILMDANKTVKDKLKHKFTDIKQIQIHFQYGYAGLNAFLPPKEKRGLVLIDPPYEDKNEFQQLMMNLKL